MAKILGLDLGTNSVGWAVVEKERNEEFVLLDKGVRIFQEGVKIEKGVEGSKAAERTGYRSARRIKYRRKLRKMKTLKVLSEYGYCPQLTKDELDLWRYKKIYPQDSGFRNWWLTDDDSEKHPYFFRNLAVTQQLDLNNETDKHKLGRAFYHMAQRRGFLSNRLDTSEDEMDVYRKEILQLLDVDYDSKNELISDVNFILEKDEDNKKLKNFIRRIVSIAGKVESINAVKTEILSFINRKENLGEVKGQIVEISALKGNLTLGQYFYQKYQKGEKIRDTYTHREDHYLDEFNRICAFQNIPKEVQNKLYNAIFFQRPLKSQKGLIGKCVFEPNKPRCAVSRPEFEEYRMLCFVNNIKIKTPDDEKLRCLKDVEKEKITPQFFRKSKEHFDFEDLAKQLAPKKQYKFYRSRGINPEDWLFNFSMKTTVSGCPVSARFKDLFGEGFMDTQVEYTRESDGKKSTIDINDIWHVLYSYDSDKKLAEFARNRLLFDDAQVKGFLKIRLKQDFASLSLKAIKKILPYLRKGLIYSHAVFLANMEEIIPQDIWKDKKNRDYIRDEIKLLIDTQNEEKDIINIVNGIITSARKSENNYLWSQEAKVFFEKDLKIKIASHFGPKRYDAFPEEKKIRIEFGALKLLEEQMQKNTGRGEHSKVQRIDERVLAFITDNFEVEEDRLNKLYHPSEIDVYKPPVKGKDGNYYLGSPMVSSIRNPMAMRAMHQLRKVVNELIKNEIIDSSSKINIEMSRGLLNANERKALQNWQRNNETKRKNAADKIREHLNGEPSDDEILKYQLWEEQQHKCIYTGNEIALSDFLGANPKYDIEHTIPRSLSFDNSQANKTLCENKFNRSVKRNRIPYELDNHSVILERIEGLKEKYEELDKQIQVAVRQSRGAMDKDSKDRFIQKRHKLSFERNYWRNKYQRFIMEDVPDGFKNSQLVDTGIITKYSRLYLNTLFDRVYTVKGNTVADFRKLWGLQDEDIKKERVNHIHHCIDAITIACITKEQYEKLAEFYHDWEDLHIKGVEQLPPADKPWATFTEDVRAIEKEVLVSHYTPDVLPKQSKKKIRVRGKVQYKADYKKDGNGNFIKDKRGRKIIESYYSKTIKDKDGNDKEVKIPLYQQGDTVRGSLHKDTFYGAIKRQEVNKKGETEEKIKYVVRKPLEMVEDNNIKNIVDERVREIVADARKKEMQLKKDIDGLKKKLQKAEEHEEAQIKTEIAGIEEQITLLYSLPNKNGAPVPIKKVRLYQPMVTNPLPDFKKHRDLSDKPYKHQYNVANDGNYVMAIYEGLDRKENLKRSFIIVNNFEAGKFFNEKLEKNPFPDKHPKSGLYLKYLIRTGSVVMFWEKLPNELKSDKVDKVKRLYKVIKMNKDGRITFKFHQEARNDEVLRLDYEKENGQKAPKSLTNGESFVDCVKSFPKLLLSPPKFNFIVEDYDFKISPSGELNWLNE